MQALPQLNTRWVELGLITLGVVFAWKMTNRAVSAVDNAVNEATKPVANVLSDFMARFNGWEPVELTPLRIRPFYLNDDMTLTADAEKTLWKIEQYYPFMLELFGGRGQPLKAKYYDLIDIPLTKEALGQ